MPHGLKTSSTVTCRSERRPRWPSCKGKKPHDQASADQVQEAVTLRSVAAFPFWSIFVDEFRASLRLFWRQQACALRPCQSRAELIRQQFGANVGIGSCVPPQPIQQSKTKQINHTQSHPSRTSTRTETCKFAHSSRFSKSSSA